MDDFSKAILDFTALIRFTQAADAYRDRARTYMKDGQYELARSDYEQSLQMGDPAKSNSKKFAWLLATCPEKKFRDGAQAVLLATRDCELTQWKNSSDLDTLAAASAEAGKFEDAVRFENHALGLSHGYNKWESDLRKRIALFQNHQPYREEVVK